jgi:hypothetical protein
MNLIFMHSSVPAVANSPPISDTFAPSRGARNEASAAFTATVPAELHAVRHGFVLKPARASTRPGLSPPRLLTPPFPRPSGVHAAAATADQCRRVHFELGNQPLATIVRDRDPAARSHRSPPAPTSATLENHEVIYVTSAVNRGRCVVSREGYRLRGAAVGILPDVGPPRIRVDSTEGDRVANVVESLELMSPPVELIADKLYLLGATVPLDGRVSWAPTRPGRFQALNCYLLREGDETLLIDTGVRALWPAISAQLRSLLEPKSRLKVFITRPELDSVGNLPLLRELYSIDETDVMAGGSDNPFDFFDAAAARGTGSGGPSPGAATSTHCVLRTTGFDLGPDRPVRVVVPKLRFLPTYWLFDFASHTLFTSDVFTHVDQDTAAPARVVTTAEETSPEEADVADHLFSKFWWLPGASIGEFKADLLSIFERLQPEMVAPAYGGVVCGRSKIQAHLDALIAVLDSCPARPPSTPHQTN